LQPVPRNPKDNGVAAMLVALTKGVNVNPFVYDHQHGSDDVTCKTRYDSHFLALVFSSNETKAERLVGMMSHGRQAMLWVVQ